MIKQKTKGALTSKQMTRVGILSAITIVMGMTGIGFIPLPAIKATIMHLPVIIGAILEGPKVGVLIGLIFGVFSVIQNIIAPTSILSFALINPIVSVLPRMMIGISAYYMYKAAKMFFKDGIAIPISAAVGSLVNSIGVMGMIYFLYIDEFAKVKNLPMNAAVKLIYGIILTNGVAEAIVAAIIVTAVVIAVKKFQRSA